MKLPSQEYLHECLWYYPITGDLLWKTRPLEHFKCERDWKAWNGRYAGHRALTSVTKQGYLQGSLNNKHVKAHRVIFKMLHGWEPEQIDHDDHNRANNVPDNLLAATAQSNNRNRGISSRNTSGATGVHFAKGKWNVHVGGKYHGRFETFEAANEAAKTERLNSGYHINHGVA